MRIAIVNQPIDTRLPPDKNSLGIWTYEAAPLLARLPPRHGLDHLVSFVGPLPHDEVVGHVQRCDLELRSTMGGNGRAWVEQLFAWEVIAETARRHYQSEGDAT